MKKMIVLAAALGLLAGGAQAQNTAQAWQFRIDMCKQSGGIAASAYRAKQDGRPYTIGAGLDATPLGPILEWSVDYATNQAVSAEDAYKVSAAKCLDNIDRVYRDDQFGKRTPIDALQ